MVSLPKPGALSRDDVERQLGLGSWPKRGRARRLAALAGLVTLLIAAVPVGRRVLPAPRGAQGATQFETARVARGDLRVTVTATGTLKAVGTVEVGSEVSGRIQSVRVNYNDHVKQGELLAEIDPVQLRAEANQASAQVLAGEASIRQADATQRESALALSRAEALMKEKLVSTADLEAARATAERARAAFETARANEGVSEATLRSSTWKLGKTKIVSPIDGIVLTRSIEPGQTVQAAFTTPVLFKLASDLSRLELHVAIDEADMGRVREGLESEFRVDAYPDRVFPSRLVSLHNDSVTSDNVVTYEAILSVDNGEGLLRPGMTATATIISATRTNVVIVPNEALRFTPPASRGGSPGAPPMGAEPALVPPEGAKSKKHVFVLRGGTPSPVWVRPGATDGKNTEIDESAVAPGMNVVVDVLEDEP